MANFLVRLAFDGATFQGTQVQPAPARTIQGLMENLLSRIYDHQVRIRCSSRLDAGVSARDFCFSFRETDRFSPEKLLSYLNSQCDRDVRIRSVRRMSESFDARGTPHAKEYVYTLDLGLFDPIFDAHAWPIYKPLDRGRLEEALNLFTGSHDFKSFSACDAPGVEEDFHSRIDSIRLTFPQRGKVCRIRIRGWAFHRYQVRLMVGAAVRVALGRGALKEIRDRLENPSISAVKVKAPAEGLVLYHTLYRGR